MSATIVSYLPYPVCEKKPSVIPEEYRIAASDCKTPTTLVIETAKSILYRGFDQPNFPISIPAEEMAEDIIKSFSASVLGYSDTAKPGLFWVPGVVYAKDVEKLFPEKVIEAKKLQNRWFLILVKMADDDWARYKQHKMITDIQRLAAKSLGLSTKEWLVMPDPVQMVKCPACFSFIEEGTVKCKYCGAILDMKKASELGLIVNVPTSQPVATK